MLGQQHRATGGEHGSNMVGMFVCLCFASQKPSEQELFIPAETVLLIVKLKARCVSSILFWRYGSRFCQELTSQPGASLGERNAIFVLVTAPCLSTFVQATKNRDRLWRWEIWTWVQREVEIQDQYYFTLSRRQLQKNQWFPQKMVLAWGMVQAWVAKILLNVTF